MTAEKSKAAKKPAKVPTPEVDFGLDEALAGDDTPEVPKSTWHVKGESVMLKADTCIEYAPGQIAMPGELFKVCGTDGVSGHKHLRDVRPTTAKEEADRLVELGIAVGAEK